MSDDETLKQYGEDPLFIFDPRDHRNEPHPQVHANAQNEWPWYPSYLRDAFIKTFHRDCLLGTRRTDRLTDLQWMKILVHLRSDLVVCGREGCPRSTFWSNSHTCSRCGKPLFMQYCMETKDYSVPLYPGAKIYRCLIEGGIESDYSSTAFQVIYSPQNNMWGLKNISGQPVERRISGSPTEYIPSGKILKISPQMELRLGSGSVRIK